MTVNNSQILVPRVVETDGQHCFNRQVADTLRAICNRLRIPFSTIAPAMEDQRRRERHSEVVASILNPLIYQGVLSMGASGTIIFSGGSSVVNHGVVIGTATGLSSTAALTNGQIVVGVTSGNPQAVSMGGDASLDSGGNLTLATVAIGKGGTGITATPTLGQALFGNNSGGYTLHTPLANLPLSISFDSTTGQPTFTTSATGTVTSIVAGTGLSGGTITSSGTISLTTPVAVANGGTGSGAFGANIFPVLNAAGTAFVNSHSTDDGTNASFDAGATGTLSLGTSTNTTSVGKSGQSLGFLGATAVVRQSGDVGTALVTFGLMSGTPSFAVANLTGQVSVAHGGTSLATLTAHALYVGNGTSAPTALAVGSNGQVLVGQTTADPAWETVSGSGATITMSSSGVIAISAIANASLSNSSITINGSSVSLGGSITVATFVAAGGSHASGAVPDPGATAHTNYPYFLGDDAAFHILYGQVLGTSYVATSETTTSTTPTDLATAQSVSFTLDATSNVMVLISVGESFGTAGNGQFVYYKLDSAGAVKCGESDNVNTSFAIPIVGSLVLTGLASGAHTIKLQFASPGGTTGTFMFRLLAVVRVP